MSIRKSLIAFAAVLAVSVAGSADAAYTYSAVVTPPSPSVINFGASSLTFGTSSGTLNGTNNIDTLPVTLTARATPGTDTLAATSFTVAITITNGGFTGTLSFTETIAGSVTFNGTTYDSTFDTTLVSYNSPTSITLGANTFSLFIGAPGSQDTFFNAPTASTAGGLTPRIVVSAAPAVPEPASLAMVAMGLGGLAVFARRRRNV